MSRFPHREPILVAGQSLTGQEIIDLVEPYLTEERKKRIHDVVAQRTYSLVPVLENIYDRGNASAVMRTAEAFGCQGVHMIELGERFKKANRVTQGADKWLDVFRWKSTSDCVHSLKDQGYQVVATHLDNSKPIGEIDFTKPTALVLGNEKDGVSEELLSLADERVIIPMQGFVQSFNISVAAAISLYHGYLERTNKLGRQGDLTSEEQVILRAVYYLRSSKNPDRLISKLLQRKMRA